MKNSHFEEHEIEAQEPTGHSCPVCETPIYRVRAEGKNWISCECMAEGDFVGKGVLVDDTGFHNSLSEIWGQEVRYMMETRNEKFPKSSLPGPVEGLDLSEEE